MIKLIFSFFIAVSLYANDKPEEVFDYMYKNVFANLCTIAESKNIPTKEYKFLSINMSAIEPTNVYIKVHQAYERFSKKHNLEYKPLKAASDLKPGDVKELLKDFKNNIDKIMAKNNLKTNPKFIEPYTKWRSEKGVVHSSDVYSLGMFLDKIVKML